MTKQEFMNMTEAERDMLQRALVFMELMDHVPADRKEELWNLSFQGMPMPDIFKAPDQGTEPPMLVSERPIEPKDGPANNILKKPEGELEGGEQPHLENIEGEGMVQKAIRMYVQNHPETKIVKV